MDQKIVTGTEYLALPRAPETWLVKPLIPSGGSAVLYGDPKVGKSYAALQLAVALATSGSWLGFPVVGQGPTVYVQLDTPRSLWADRIGALGLSGVPVDRVHFADRETLGIYPFDILNPEHAQTLKDALQLVSPVAVIMDTLREVHTGDEDKSGAMQAVMSTLIATVSPAALIMISHARKFNPERGADLINDQRGSGHIVGKVDCILRFTRKSAYFTGRAIEEGSIHLERLDNGFWEPTISEHDQALQEILADESASSVRAKARLLADKIGKSESACRAMIRRALA